MWLKLGQAGQLVLSDERFEEGDPALQLSGEKRSSRLGLQRVRVQIAFQLDDTPAQFMRATSAIVPYLPPG